MGHDALASLIPGAIIVDRDLSVHSDLSAAVRESTRPTSIVRRATSVRTAPSTSQLQAAPSFSSSADFSSVLKAVTVSAASSVLSGYDQGVIAAAMLTMRPALGLSGVQQELSIGVTNVAAAFGGVLASYVAEARGRKLAICIANLFFLVGSLAIAAAQGFWLLFAGRALQGVGVGFALVVAPVFTAELVPAAQRGMLVSLSDCSTNLGILLGYSSGLVFLHTPSGWRWMFAVGGVPAVLIVLVIWAVPESPRWLVGVGRDRTALSALNALYTSALAADKFLADIQGEREAAARSEHSGSWRQVLWHEDGVLRGMIWRGLAIAFFSQAIGTEAVVYYAPEIVRAAGVRSDRDVLLATMAIGGVKLLVLLVASQLFDRLGRRPLLLASGVGLLAGLVTMAAGELVPSERAARALALGGLCGYMGAFSLGFSPLTYVMCSELFPSSVRARAMSLALFVTRIVAGVISSSFVSVRHALGGAGTWLLFAPVALGAIVFVALLVPETRGHSLEEVAGIFRARAHERERAAAVRAARRAARAPTPRGATPAPAKREPSAAVTAESGRASRGGGGDDNDDDDDDGCTFEDAREMPPHDNGRAAPADMEAAAGGSTSALASNGVTAASATSTRAGSSLGRQPMH